MSPEELGDRAKYANIIREAFSGILVDRMSRLLDAAETGDTTTQNEVANPTQLRHELEGSTEVVLAFVSEVRAMVRRRERRYTKYRRLAISCFVIAAAAFILCWIPGVLIDAVWAYRITVGSLLSGCLFASAGLVSILVFALSASSIKLDAREFSDHSGLMKQFEEWKANGNS